MGDTPRTGIDTAGPYANGWYTTRRHRHRRPVRQRVICHAPASRRPARAPERNVRPAGMEAPGQRVTGAENQVPHRGGH